MIIIVQIVLAIYFVGVGAAFAVRSAIQLRDALRGYSVEFNPWPEIVEALLWPWHFLRNGK